MRSASSGPHGPGNTFNPRDPAARPVRARPRAGRRVRGMAFGRHRRRIFDWGGVEKPRVPLDRTVIYEGHLKGLTKRHPEVPPALHGTYAGLAHPAMIELLPRARRHRGRAAAGARFRAGAATARARTHATTGATTPSTSSPRTTPTPPRSTKRGARGRALPSSRAWCGCCTRPASRSSSTSSTTTPPKRASAARASSLRGIDNAVYYRQDADGAYIDRPDAATRWTRRRMPAARLVLDSLRYWAQEMQIDGFRFDLAAALARDAQHTSRPSIPCCRRSWTTRSCAT